MPGRGGFAEFRWVDYPFVPVIRLRLMIKTMTLVFAVWAQVEIAMASPDLLSVAWEGFKHEEMRAALKELGKDVNEVRDGQRQTALHLSAQRSQFEDVLLLLQAGADPNAADSSGKTPIFSSAAQPGGNAFLVTELLILAGADVNHVAEGGSTPLIEAVKAGNRGAAAFLLRRGAELEVADVAADEQPLALARENGNAALISLLEAAQDRRAASQSPSTEAPAWISRQFVAAAKAADLSEVARALANGADINQRDGSGTTALFRAVKDRRPDLVTLLLLEGADPKIADKNGRTPLMEATSFLDHHGMRMILLLLLAHADVNAEDKNGRTALSAAVARCNDFGAKWMIWQGAKLKVTTPDGTLMQMAKARVDWPSMVSLLKDAGVPDDAPLPPRPEQALLDGVRAGKLDVVESELNKGVAATAVDAEGCSPLAWAVHYGHFNIVDLLLQRGADINQRNTKSGYTVLHEIARWGRGNGDANLGGRYLKELINRGANPDLCTSDGSTALMIAARHGVAGEGLKVLMEANFDINARNKAGKTALAIARSYGFKDVADQLAAGGASE